MRGLGSADPGLRGSKGQTNLGGVGLGQRIQGCEDPRSNGSGGAGPGVRESRRVGPKGSVVHGYGGARVRGYRSFRDARLNGPRGSIVSGSTGGPRVSGSIRLGAQGSAHPGAWGLQGSADSGGLRPS